MARFEVVQHLRFVTVCFCPRSGHLNVAQRFSAGITGKEEKEAREAGDRMSVPFAKSVARFAGFKSFFDSLPSPEGLATVSRPLGGRCPRKVSGSPSAKRP